jgi:hypothetical protein
MKPKNDPLGRLFKAAAQAPPREVPAKAPFAVERRAIAQWRNGTDGMVEDWFTFLPVFRRGLAFACGLALVALVFTYVERDEPADEVAIIDSVMTLSYLP